MTEGMEQRHFSDGAIILEKALEFIAFSTPTEASDRRSPKTLGCAPVLPLGSPLATHCLERIVRTTKHVQRRP